jgi:type IV pilus assembly protein PilW
MIMSCRNHNIGSKANEAGFTLVELMIAVLVSGLVMAAVVSVYITQSRSYSAQDDIANMQQDLRGALVILASEIRLAGCDPTESGVPKILAARRDRFHFTMDVRGNANSNNADGDVEDPGENVAFGYANNIDTNNNGIVDNGGADWSGTASLGRDTGGGAQPLADNIEALEFNYVLSDGTSTNGSGVATATQTNIAISDPNQVRAVSVSILARAANPAQGFLNTQTYTTASGTVWGPFGDNFRRRFVVTNIQGRNAGL